ncbi:MAG: hypothetical protein WBG85_12525 [Rhodanobacter sp.]
MQGFWSPKNWRLDDDALLLPSGQRIALRHIRQWQADRIAGSYDLTGKWPGWRVRQQWLIAPGGTIKRGRIAQHVLRQLMQFSEWEQQETSRRQLALF